LGNFAGARPWGNNVVRYCVSVNDAKTNNSAVTLFTAPNTQWNGLKLYNNTIVVSPSAKNKYPDFGAFQMTDYGTTMSGVECYNNIFYTSGGLPLVSVPATFAAQNPKFIGNAYYANNEAFKITYGTAYNSLTTFRNAGAFCEKNGSTNTGIDVNPLLQNMGKNPLTVFPKPTDSLDAFALTQNSPCRNAGLDLKTLFGIDMGSRDYVGKVNKTENAYDIGAFEYGAVSSGFVSSEDARVLVYPNPAGNEGVIVDTRPLQGAPIRIEFIDISGKKYVQQQLEKGLNKIDIQQLPVGVYSIVITDNVSTHTTQFIKNE
jgi:hypothetical protein